MMKFSFLLLLSITTITQVAMTQKKTPRINHIALYVVDLQKSATFYREVIGLDTIPEPFHDGKHAWFSMSEHSHVHVISGALLPAGAVPIRVPYVSR